MSPGTRRALGDILGGLMQWRIWGLLGWRDIRQRYRRTALGPLWLTINVGIFIAMIGFLYSRLLRQTIEEYITFLALGYIAWTFLATYIVEVCDAFTRAEKIIKQRSLPLSIFIYRILWHNIIVFAHNLVVFVIVAALFPVPITWSTWLFVPGLALFTINAAWAGLLMGTLTARFRDIQQFLASGITIVFFITPVFWRPEMLGTRAGYVLWNPFYHFIELLRAPLLGTSPSQLTWFVATASAVLGWAGTFLVFRHVRTRIPYWL